MNHQLRVEPDLAGLRLDLYLAQALPQMSRSRAQALLRAGHVLLNGSRPRPRDPVHPGDLVTVEEPPAPRLEAEPQDIPLHLLHEDDDLLVVNKPPGLVVHPGAGNARDTLVNALLHHCTTLSRIGDRERPGIVHRIDKDTSGCLVVAKTDQAHQSLSQQFAERTVEKVYLALAAGTPRRVHGEIEAPIGRHPVHRQRMSVEPRRGRAARTGYRVLTGNGDASLVECRLHSGRTHQIRVHLHHLGHPILGDRVYGPRLAARFPRQMLHAWKLGFLHPRDGTARLFVAPCPADFRTAMASLALRHDV